MHGSDGRRRHSGARLSPVAALVVLVTVSSCVSQARVPGSVDGEEVLVRARFDPAWSDGQAWDLTLLSTGDVVVRGRDLGRTRRALQPAEMAELGRLVASVEGWGRTIDSPFEDADGIAIGTPGPEGMREIVVMDPRLLACDAGLAPVLELWNLLIELVAPRASCNGSTCRLCGDGEELPGSGERW